MWLKKFEDYSEYEGRLIIQPLSKEDIITYLEGTGIDLYYIKEDIIKRDENKYLCWILKINEGDASWFDLKLKNYKIEIKSDKLIYLIWQRKLTGDQLLSVITPKWKDLKDKIENMINESDFSFDNNYLAIWRYKGIKILSITKESRILVTNSKNYEDYLRNIFYIHGEDLLQFTWLLIEELYNFKIKSVV